MPKEFSRSQRVVEQIRRELAELLRTEVKDPRVGFITLTDVEITPDYAHAKVSWAAACASTPRRNCTSYMTSRSRRAAACPA
jgi:ribosome-binding factor A